MPSTNSSWLDEEESRATKQAKTGTTPNPDVKITKIEQTKPAKTKKFERSVKGLRLRVDLQEKFEQLALEQKHKQRRLMAPELADEAIKLLLDKYGVKYKD